MKWLNRCMGFYCLCLKVGLRPHLSLSVAIALVLIANPCNLAFSQTPNSSAEDINSAISSKSYDRINKISSEANKLIAKKSLKYIKELKKAELGLESVITRTSTMTDLGDLTAQQFYESLSKQIEFPDFTQSSGNRQYVPQLDSMLTSLKFLQDKNLSNPQLAKLNQNSLKEMVFLQNRLDQMNSIQKSLLARRTMLEAKLSSIGQLKALKKYGKTFAEFQSQAKAIQENLNQPDKLIAFSINQLQKLPEFRKFFQKNSTLASFFRLPDPGQPIDVASFEGLQTKEQLKTLMQEKFGVNTAGSQFSNLNAHQEQRNCWHLN